MLSEPVKHLKIIYDVDNWNCNSQHALHGQSKTNAIKYYFYAVEHDEKRARLDSVQFCWVNHFSAQHFADFPLKCVGNSLQNNVTKCIVHAIPVSQIMETKPEYENLLAKPAKWTLWCCTNQSLHVIPSRKIVRKKYPEGLTFSSHNVSRQLWVCVKAPNCSCISSALCS